MAYRDDEVVTDARKIDPEAFFALAAAAFQEAVSDAIAENDRLGIAGVGAVNGQIVIRQPPVSARS